MTKSNGDRAAARTREERLAAALKANLQRRKAQAREREQRETAEEPAGDKAAPHQD